MSFKGMPGGGNMQALAQQAKKMMKELETAQAEIAQFKGDGDAGNGLVKVTINGKYEIESLALAKEVVDPSDIPMLQDLIVKATNEALAKVKTHIESKMGKATGGFSLPGMF